MLKVSNEITQRAFMLATRAAKRGVVVSIENPGNSLMWHCSYYEAFVRDADVATIKHSFDMCAFGAKYRKRTSVVASATFDFSRCTKTCPGNHMHLGLSGWSINRDAREKRMPTKQAAAYPDKLCKQWALCVKKHFLG